MHKKKSNFLVAIFETLPNDIHEHGHSFREELFRGEWGTFFFIIIKGQKGSSEAC